MEIFFSEHNKDYTTYTFDYAVYAIMENMHELPAIFEKGFLPYSNDLTEKQEIYYLSRSLRVNLNDFRDSSENRRVDQKVSELDLILEVRKKQDFDLNDPGFRQLCLDYASNRFTGNSMSEERFVYITHRQNFSHIFTFLHNRKPIAYIFSLIEGNILHYWYSFFKLEFMEKYPIGKWLMWKAIQWARENGLSYVYLGTCYGEKALYKVRDFKGLVFFDGKGWNPDMKLLKSWCKSDGDELPADRFKLRG